MHLPPPIPAATLILMRTAASGPPELLMMERPADMAFAAGALVFPGGRIEPEDAAGGADDETAARRAAVRETAEETGIAVDPEALIPYARWCPNFRETRRFDARFYLAEAPANAPPPVPQPGEAVRAFWASAAATLAELAAGRAHAIFPTRRNLERLAQFKTFAAARADALAHPIRMITPWIEQRSGEPYLCIPDDLGYPVAAELLATARRG